MQIPFAKRVEFEKNDSVMVYRAKDAKGRDFFCYIRCKLEGYKKMHEDFETRTAGKPSDYGEIIYRDFLKDPDQKAKDFLAEYLKNAG